MLALVDSDNKILSRFEAKYTPDPNSGCWLWIGGVDSSGYGTFVYNKKTLGAHRVSFMLFNGEIPKNTLVCHHCDVRCCVNPKHLFLGSPADNMKDRNSKGRQVHLKGDTNGNSKLSVNDVLWIKEEYNKGGITLKELGKKFNVHKSTIHLIIKGRNWKHLLGCGYLCTTKEVNSL